MQGRAFAWLLTCKVLSGKEWDDFRAAQGQSHLGALGPIAVKDTGWEGLCPQRCPPESGLKNKGGLLPNSCTDESKVSAADPHRQKVPDPSERSSRGWLRGYTQSLGCFPDAGSWGSPKLSPGLWRRTLRVCISTLPPNVWGPFLKGLCEAALSVPGVRFLSSPSCSRSRALLGHK